MVMVLAALLIAGVLSLTFLLSQGPSAAIAQNVQSHARARLIAESGLTTAIEYIRTSETWRNDQTSGDWLPAVNYAGGSFEIMIEDEDGDLADDTADSVTITCYGLYGSVSHHVTATVSPSLAAFDGYGLEVGGSVMMINAARIDGYRSSAGAYGGFNQQLDAQIATNATSANQYAITDSAMVYGDIYVGVGGNPDTVIDASLSAITGTTAALTEPLDPPDATLPTGLPASSGNKDISSNTTLSDNKTYDDLTLKSNARLAVSGDVIIHVTKKLTITNSSYIEIPDGSTLTLYVAGDVDFDTTATVNADTANPDKLRIVQYQPGYKVSFHNASSIAARLESTSDVVISNDTQFYGTLSLVGSLEMTNSSRIHVDLTAAPLGGTSDTALNRILWLER